MSKFKIRADGSPPYNGFAKNFNGVVIHAITNYLSDEIEIPDSAMNNLAGGVEVSLTDSTGKTAVIKYDNGTLFAMKEFLIGFSVSNGDAANQVDKIIDGNSRGFNFVGAMVESGDFQNDAQLIAVEGAGVFDANAPLPPVPIWNIDKTIKTLVSQNTCNKARFNIWLQRQYAICNNGTTRKLFINKSDSQMRPDGVTPIIRQFDQGELTEYFNTIFPSYAAPNTLAMAKRLTLLFFKRYLPYINSGNIIAVGCVVVSSGEGEMCSVYAHGNNLEDHMGSGMTHGDFNPYNIAWFKQRYPEYNNKNNQEIASSSGEFQMKWREHNNFIINDFENKVADYVNANCPGLKRFKWQQKDSGSFVDNQAYFRCTLNSTDRAMHPSAFLWKSNDNSNLPLNTVKFYLDHLTSLARKSGGIAICEPSPPNYEDSSNTGYLVTEIKEAYDRGAGISYYTPNGSIATNLTNLSGVVKGDLPKNKNEFKIVNGQKRLQKHKVNLSDVLVNGGFGQSGAWLNSWSQFKASQSLDHVDTTSTNNVKP